MKVMHGLHAVLATSILMLGCGGSKPEPAPPPQPAPSEAHAHGEGGGMGGMCPMAAQGAKVTAEDTQDGIAITFTTTGDVAQLRQRVHHMAEMHEHMMQGGSGGMGSGHMMMKRVPSTARAEDIEGGARLVLTPKDPAQLTELRAHVHEHASQMASGQCPMMEHRG